MKQSRVKKLRQLKAKGSPIPNFKAKLWALRIQDEITGHEALPSYPDVDPGEKKSNIQNNDDLVICGTDVEALFPSLKDVESARIVREAVMKTEAYIENFNCKAALKYLSIVGGPAHLKECGLGHLAPRWTGPRPDLLTVGGESGHSEENGFFQEKTSLESKRG